MNMVKIEGAWLDREWYFVLVLDTGHHFWVKVDMVWYPWIIGGMMSTRLVVDMVLMWGLPLGRRGHLASDVVQQKIQLMNLA